METRSLKKQLMAAIAMVVVAAIALTSATYAWFANNNRVTADGLTINAKSEGVLLVISKDEAGLDAKVTSVTLDAEAKKLYPIHPIYAVDSEITAWKHAFSGAFNEAITDLTNEEVVTVDDTTGKAGDDAYFLHTSLYIGLDNTNGDARVKNVRVDSKDGVVISGAEGLKNCARVLMAVNGKVVAVYAPKGRVTTDGSADGETGFEFEAFSDEVKEPNLIDELASGGKVKVDLYLYFDGRDEDCTSENFSAEDLTVELAFTADIQ